MAVARRLCPGRGGACLLRVRGCSGPLLFPSPPTLAFPARLAPAFTLLLSLLPPVDKQQAVLSLERGRPTWAVGTVGWAQHKPAVLSRAGGPSLARSLVEPLAGHGLPLAPVWLHLLGQGSHLARTLPCLGPAILLARPSSVAVVLAAPLCGAPGQASTSALTFWAPLILKPCCPLPGSPTGRSLRP